MFGVSAGVMDAMPAGFAFLHHPDHLSRILNGRLTGLGLITAGADWVTPTDSVAIGVIDCCDTPFWELTAMMRRISENMMQYRLDGKYECGWDQ